MIHAILCLTESIKYSIGKCGYGIFLDLQKTFDTVNHEILLQKLKDYGVRENALDWFHSYLTARTQYVNVNGQVSSSLLISFGVPQGFVIVQLLSNIC